MAIGDFLSGIFGSQKSAPNLINDEGFIFDPAQAAAGTDLFGPQFTTTTQAPGAPRASQAPVAGLGNPMLIGPAPAQAQGVLGPAPAPSILDSIFNVDTSGGTANFVDSFFNPKAHAKRKIAEREAAIEAAEKAREAQILRDALGATADPNAPTPPAVSQFLSTDPVAGRAEVGKRLGVERRKTQPLTPLEAKTQAAKEKILATEADEHTRNVELLRSGAFAISPERVELMARNPKLAAEFIKKRSIEPLAGTKQSIQESTAALKAFEVEEKAKAKAQGFRSPVEISGQESVIRKEYTALTKPFRIVRDSFGKLREAVAASKTDPTGARDIAIVFSFMKMLDPNSVIRESEFATAENTAGVPEKIRIQYNKLMNGQRLAKAQRANFLSAANGFFKTENRQFKSAEKQYRKIAKRMGVNPLNAVPDFELIKDPPSQRAIEFMRQNSQDTATTKQFIQKFGEDALLDALANQGPQQ